ncbi:hypothetical protein Plhal304r1_c047g0128731 [Plasmopara halstedii]
MSILISSWYLSNFYILLLSGSSINTARSLPRVVDTLSPRLSVLSHYGTFVINPCPPEGILAAFHIWTFDGQDIVDDTNGLIHRLLKSSLPLQLPLQSLQLNGISPPVNHWSTLRKLQCDILPVFFDFVVRLQHNGLGFRYKFGWHTHDINCVYGCSTPETPKHLLWECYTANTIWCLFLPLFQWIFDTTIQWEHALFLVNLTIPSYRQHDNGIHLPLRLFNIIRCCILRTLWINRNKAIYDPPCLHFMGVFRQSLTMIRRNLQRIFKA